jgi:phosphoglycolate phosphatase-like HAD superfamily hydrolase
VTYGYNYGEHIGKYQPDRVVDDLSEILSFLGEKAL